MPQYLFGNKLYSVFKVEETLLTASYELRDSTLIFEVTSGKAVETAHETIGNYDAQYV